MSWATPIIASYHPQHDHIQLWVVLTPPYQYHYHYRRWQCHAKLLAAGTQSAVRLGADSSHNQRQHSSIHVSISQVNQPISPATARRRAVQLCHAGQGSFMLSHMHCAAGSEVQTMLVSMPSTGEGEGEGSTQEGTDIKGA